MTVDMGNSETTRQRLLHAGCEAFARQGFRDASIRDICQQAEANVAAVNYHFGDKRRLYQACWRYAQDLAFAAHPVRTAATESRRPAEQLRVFVRNFLGRVFAPGLTGCFARLMLHEMVEPTDELPEIVARAIRPVAENLQAIVGELIGPAASADVKHACTASVVGQCMFFNFNKPVLRLVSGSDEMSTAQLDAMADHITTFCLGGMAEVRRRLGAGETTT